MKRLAVLLVAVAGWLLFSAGAVATADESGAIEPTDVIIIDCPVGTGDVPTDSGTDGGTGGGTDVGTEVPPPTDVTDPPVETVTDDPIGSDTEVPPDPGTETITEGTGTDGTDTSLPSEDITSTEACGAAAGAEGGAAATVTDDALAFGGDETTTQLLIALLLIGFGAAITYLGRGVARHARHRR